MIRVWGKDSIPFFDIFYLDLPPLLLPPPLPPPPFPSTVGERSIYTNIKYRIGFILFKYLNNKNELLLQRSNHS